MQEEGDPRLWLGGSREVCVAAGLFFPAPVYFSAPRFFSSGVPSADHKALGARQLQPGKGDSEGPALPSKPEMSNANPLKSLLSHPCPWLRMNQAPALVQTIYTGIIYIPGPLGLWGLSSCFKLNFATEICPEQ